MERTRSVGGLRHEVRSEQITVDMNAERARPGDRRRWWRNSTVRRCERNGPADLLAKVPVSVKTVEVASPSLVGRLGRVAEPKTPMEVRELGHRVGEVVRAERRRSTSEAKLKFDVAGWEFHTIAEHRASLPGCEPTMCEPRRPCHGRGWPTASPTTRHGARGSLACTAI